MMKDTLSICKILSVLAVLLCTRNYVKCDRIIKFPPDFLIGTATSSYQVEGAWNEDGKSPSIWDHFTHNYPNKIDDGSNGDIACDSYHKINEDVQLIKSSGFQYYRFSVSWPRIMPSGFSNKINPAGIAYYNKLIDELLANNIIPMLTMYHWDLPQSLQELGGFVNPEIANWFEDYARVLFTNFGDRVKYWITINEPKQICSFGYGLGYFAPGIEKSGISDYLCGHNVLKAHARAYHLYNNHFRSAQKGIIGIVIELVWAEPASNKTEDIAAADRHRQFEYGLYANPVFHKDGDYPQVVKDKVAKRSKAEGFPRSRLPEFTPEEIQNIKGTSDFIGVNHYTSVIVKDVSPAPIGEPHLIKDMQTEVYQDDNWLTGTHPYFRLVPWGFRKILNYVKDNYGNPDIYITENGFPDKNDLDDQDRIKYFKGNFEAVLNATYFDQVPIKSYTTWTLLDNFEWAGGYRVKFGLHYVNFSDPSRPRIEKSSIKFIKDLLNTRELKIN